MIFYLGTHHPEWLKRTDVPFFISRTALARYKRLPRAIGSWALDSGAFTELKNHGEWRITAREYAAEVRRYRDEIGNMAWAAPQDWMCEPIVIQGGVADGQVFVGTKLCVTAHQRLTTENYLQLKALAPDLPWIPVLQGYTMADYLRHADAYDLAGVDLQAAPLVGLGSVCRRQGTQMIEDLVRRFHGIGVRLHAFGFKLTGLRRCARYLASSDSMAWSYDARRSPPLPGCKGHKTCNNCMVYALWWRGKALRAAAGSHVGEQKVLFA